MLASKNTRAKVSSTSITTFRKNLTFSANFHCIYDRVFTANYNEGGEISRKPFSIGFHSRKKTWAKFLSWKQCLPAVMNNQSSDSGFGGISLLHSQNYSSVKISRVKKVLNTAAEGSCCFTLISGTINKAEMYDTNNKRSPDLSDYTKQRSLNF